MKSTFVQLLLTAFILVGISGCSKDGGINIFSVQDDIELGAQFAAEIDNDPSFNFLSESQYPEAYDYMYAMRDEILNSGEVTHKDDFVWQLKIIHDDSTLNAFATPGGYIYIYTGLIHYLDSASSLAGVVGHEIAHADRRHSTSQLTKAYGYTTLLSVALGQNPSLLKDITAGLLSLKFSRGDETDADNHSVKYLCNTKYRANGAADFFQKIVDSGAPTPPQFLSTHPNPDNRVENIHEQHDLLSCGSNGTEDGYAAFKASLP